MISSRGNLLYRIVIRHRRPPPLLEESGLGILIGVRNKTRRTRHRRLIIDHTPNSLPVLMTATTVCFVLHTSTALLIACDMSEPVDSCVVDDRIRRTSISSNTLGHADRYADTNRSRIRSTRSPSGAICKAFQANAGASSRIVFVA